MDDHDPLLWLDSLLPSWRDLLCLKNIENMRANIRRCTTVSLHATRLLIDRPSRAGPSHILEVAVIHGFKRGLTRSYNGSDKLGSDAGLVLQGTVSAVDPPGLEAFAREQSPQLVNCGIPVSRKISPNRCAKSIS